MAAPVWLSIGVLSLSQAATVALPGPQRLRQLSRRVHGRLWGLVPVASIVLFVLAGRLARQASAQGLTYLALAAVPVLAALALGWLAQRARPRNVLLVAALFALAWVDRGGLIGQAAALALVALSCAALGALLAAVSPARWLAAGIALMALADSALVLADLLQAPNNVLNGARPAAGLPQLQSAAFGSAVMGYGDLFLAGVLGGLLAAHRDRVIQWWAALTVALLALGFDLLLLFVDELPATVPVAVTLLVLEISRRGVCGDTGRALDQPGT